MIDCVNEDNIKEVRSMLSGSIGRAGVKSKVEAGYMAPRAGVDARVSSTGNGMVGANVTKFMVK